MVFQIFRSHCDDLLSVRVKQMGASPFDPRYETSYASLSETSYVLLESDEIK